MAYELTRLSGLPGNDRCDLYAVTGCDDILVLKVQSGISKDDYHATLKDLEDRGVKKVVVDVSGVERPVDKLSFVYMKPTSEQVPGIKEIYVSGVTNKEIGQGAHSEHAARSLRNSPSITRSIEEAIAQC